MDELQRLEAIRLAGPALSLYLPLEGDAVEEGFVKRWLAHLRRESAGGAEAEADAGLHEELERVEAGLRALNSRAPGIAAFASGAVGLLRIIELPEPPAPLLVYSEALETEPLRALLVRRRPALVAVVDKEHGWLFEVSLDGVRELVAVEGSPVHHHRQGQTLATALQRRADHQVERNLRPLAQALEKALRAPGLGYRVIVAGPAEARSTLLAELDRRSRAAVEREAAIPAYLKPGEMRKRVMELARQEITEETAVATRV